MNALRLARRQITLLAMTLLLACATAQNSAELSQAAQGALQSLDVQRRLPSDAAGQPDQREADMRRMQPNSPSRGLDLTPRLPWPALLKTLFWLGAICTCALLVAWILETWFLRRSGSSLDLGFEGDSAKVQRDAPRLLADADQLAAAGRYREAMHRLLLDTVATLHRRLKTEIPNSLTSREILQSVALLPAEQQAFREIVNRVEQAWFGERPAGLSDYTAVRKSFEMFAPAAAAVSA